MKKIFHQSENFFSLRRQGVMSGGFRIQAMHMQSILPAAHIEVFSKMNYGQLLIDHPDEVARRISEIALHNIIDRHPATGVSVDNCQYDSCLCQNTDTYTGKGNFDPVSCD